MNPRWEIRSTRLARPCGRVLARLVVFMLLLCLGGVGCSDDGSADSKDTEAERKALSRQLNSLPYVTSTRVRAENKGLRSVVRHEKERAYQGLNLYGSLTRREAHLRTMSGDLIHTWTAEGVFTDRQDFPLSPEALIKTDGLDAPGLTVAEIHDKHLLAIESLSGLVKLDWQSQVVFALNNNAHHDVDVAADGSIYVLTAAPRWVDVGRDKIIIADDIIERISPDGDLLQSYSIFELLAEDAGLRPLVGESLRVARHWFDNMDQWQAAKIKDKEAARPEYEAMFRLYDEVFVQKTRILKRSHELYVLYRTPADILHSNTIEVLTGHPDGLWDDGQVMVSVRNLDLVVVLDLDQRKVVWSWGPGQISRQHQPTTLADGNILLFNNGTEVGRSSILELNPVTGQIVWTYGDKPETRFFCGAMGGVQRLQNGNTLVTESVIGRVFEVDRQGHIVWDFFNPEKGYNPFGERAEEETIEAIYRLVRVDTADLESLAGR